jgi:hypothetical protein
LRHRLAKGHQRERTALTLVVGVEQHQHVLDRDDQEHGPYDQRQDAEYGLGAGRGAVFGGGRHGLAQGVEGTGANVAVDDTQGTERQGPKALVAFPVLGAMNAGGCLCHLAGVLELRVLVAQRWARLIHPIGPPGKLVDAWFVPIWAARKVASAIPS